MKFIKAISTTCIPNYPDRNLPTVFVYREGDIKAQFIGPLVFGGMNLTIDGEGSGGPEGIVRGGPGTPLTGMSASGTRVASRFCFIPAQSPGAVSFRGDPLRGAGALADLLFLCLQSWSGNCLSQERSRQPWRRTPRSPSRTCCCPQSGALSP